MARRYLYSAIHTDCVLLPTQAVDKAAQPLRCKPLQNMVIFCPRPVDGSTVVPSHARQGPCRYSSGNCGSCVSREAGSAGTTGLPAIGWTTCFAAYATPTKPTAGCSVTPQPSMARRYLYSTIHTACVLLSTQVVDNSAQPLYCGPLQNMVIFCPSLVDRWR